MPNKKLFLLETSYSIDDIDFHCFDVEPSIFLNPVLWITIWIKTFNFLKRADKMGVHLLLLLLFHLIFSNNSAVSLAFCISLFHILFFEFLLNHSLKIQMHQRHIFARSRGKNNKNFCSKYARLYKMKTQKNKNAIIVDGYLFG